MAWDPIQDIRRNCKSCNSRRFFSPNDFTHKTRVLETLKTLEGFFRKKTVQKSENPCLRESAFLIRKNKEFCVQLAKECQQCNRSMDHVNQKMVLLK